MARDDTAQRIASVSIDLDPLECYFRIHALAEAPPDAARSAVLRHALPRFVELFDRHGVKATLFVVARDLEEDGQGRRLLEELARAGHELASHTYSHPYDLVALPPARMAEEIDKAHALLAAAVGRPPVGFRAPGYEVSGPLMDLLCARGYLYDSSTFPSVPYYLAKAAVMGTMDLLGRPSGSHLGTPRVLAAPRAPYHPAQGAPYRMGFLPIVELPMAVTPTLRLPVIGTTLVTAPEPVRRRLVAGALRAPFFNLELHGIDLADADGDGIPRALAARQPDLRVSLPRKLAALDATLRQAREAGFRFERLDAVAARLRGSSTPGSGPPPRAARAWSGSGRGLNVAP